MSLRELAKTVFNSAIHATLPRNLVLKQLKVNGNQLIIRDTSFALDHNVYVVGFGKAVLGMAVAIDQVLDQHLVEGIISIPSGLMETLANGAFSSVYGNLKSGSVINVIEGAHNNFPDAKSLQAAVLIESLVKRVPEDALLITLVSGGGSALLPAPAGTIALEEKRDVIKSLSETGATIQEMNTVRRKLSRLKGGKLVELTAARQVLSLIISDIVGDHVDLISSGPTVKEMSMPAECASILEKYGLTASLPQSIRDRLKSLKSNRNVDPFDWESKHVENFLVGTNYDALEAARVNAEHSGYDCIVLTKSLTGEAKDVGKLLATFLFECMFAKPDVYKYRPLSEDIRPLISIMERLKVKRGKTCILSGGETTVAVQGTGMGGRNQELALSASLAFDELYKKYPGERLLDDNWFCMQSAGTDGQDGPTPAAGAFVIPNINERCNHFQMDPYFELKNNNSYDFYKNFDIGGYHVLTGLTGTNVMDLQIILIDFDKIY